MSQQGQRFRRRALRRGYKVDEVDDFLDRVESTLAGRPLGEPVRSRDVHDYVFRVRFGGYDEWQVDMHLDRVERELGALEESGGLPRPEPAPLTAGHDNESAFALPPADPHFGMSHDEPRFDDAGRFDEPTRYEEPARYDDRFDEPTRYQDEPGRYQDEPARYQDDPGRYHDEPARAQREDEPTMVRPARAAASVPQPDQMGPAAGAAPVRSGTASVPGQGGPPSPGRPSPSRQPAPEPHGGSEFTQKLPPVAPGYEGGDFAAQPSRREHNRYEDPRYDPEPPQFESEQRFAPEAPRFEPDPQRYQPEPPRFDQHGGYGQEPPHRGGYDAEPRRYDPEPPRFEPAAQGGPDRDHGRGEQGGYDGGASRYQSGMEPGRHGKVDMTAEIPAADSPFTPDDLHRLDQVRRTFTVRRFGSGYDPAQVNRLFDAIAATMSGRATIQVSDSELDPGQFSLVQGGLFEAEVDGALRDVRDIFARRGIFR